MNLLLSLHSEMSMHGYESDFRYPHPVPNEAYPLVEGENFDSLSESLHIADRTLRNVLLYSQKNPHDFIVITS